MKRFRLRIEKRTRRNLETALKRAEYRGDLQSATRLKAVLAVADGNSHATVATILRVSEQSVTNWVKAFLLKREHGLIAKKSSGRPSKLTNTQKEELRQMIIDGPQKAGFPGACWRSPMIQALILDKFKVFYSVPYISQLLRNMGFSYQKAKFVADHKDPEKRKEWLEQKWPEIMKLAKEKNAHVLFGDEASFPQWGSLTYTWALRGQQPTVPTSGKRKGYKVLGLIDFFTGRLFCKGHEGRLNSESYAGFLQEVLSKTRKHIILIQDGARYHTSKAMREFFSQHQNRLTVYQLPSYSPDYNPIEKLWKKIKEKEIHLHYFPTFESLMTKVKEALLRFENMSKEILSLFGFYRELQSAAGI